MTSHSWSGSAFPVAARDCCPHFGQPRATLWKAGLLGLVGTLCTSMSAICGRLCIRGDPHKVEVRLRLDDQRAGRVRGCVGSHVQGRVGGWLRRWTNCGMIAYSGLLFPALTVVGLPVSTASFEHGHDDDGVCGRHLGQAFGHQKIGWIRHRNVYVRWIDVHPCWRKIVAKLPSFCCFDFQSGGMPDGAQSPVWIPFVL